MKQLTILDAMADAKLFGAHFAGPTWDAWRAFLAALFGLPLSEDALEVYEAATGRAEPPDGPAEEAWVIAGRRAGKSLIAALVGVFLAAFRDYSGRLAPGEQATVMIIAADRRQARVIFRYVSGFLDSPMLRPMVRRRLKESVELSNRVTLEVHSSSFRTTRGYSIAAALCDEVAFWRQEDSAEPDKEVINALRPGLASVPGSLLLCLSSPYSRRGELWRTHQRHFGKDSGVLVWQAPTALMNPSIDRAVIERAMEEDPAAASAEWLAEFRVDVEDFIALEAVEAVIELKIIERPPESGISYRAFCDPSGGSGRDSMTLAVSHEVDDVRILDAVRERRPPFSPEAVVKDFCELLKSYKVRTVEGDRYAGEWPREQFRKCGVTYEPATMPKSDLYLNLLPAINSGRVKLLDAAKLKTQLVSLERRTSRSGKDSIDHPPGAHDDVANAVAGALVAAKPVHHQIYV